MTASVTGFSIVQGFASALDTLLPSAWTSGNPQLVGLWLQRMLLLVTLLSFVSRLLFHYHIMSVWTTNRRANVCSRSYYYGSIQNAYY